MNLIVKPRREYDTRMVLEESCWCEFWWEERVLLAANLILYKFDSDFRFFFEYGQILHAAYFNEDSVQKIKSAYAWWLLEKELKS